MWVTHVRLINGDEFTIKAPLSRVWLPNWDFLCGLTVRFSPPIPVKVPKTAVLLIWEVEIKEEVNAD